MKELFLMYGFVYCNDKRIIIFKLAFDPRERSKKLSLRFYINKFNKNDDALCMYYLLKIIILMENMIKENEMNRLKE